MPGASVVIPNWNGAQRLSPLISSLADQTEPPQEILVVDNGSTDDSVALARALGAHVIELRQNRGFAAAVNEGLRAAGGEWIAILNNDVSVACHWLETLRSHAERSDAWFATGKLIDANRPRQLDGAWDALCRGACAWRCGAARTDGPAWNAERPIRFAPFTAALFRADLFRRVGYLDEAFESYLEDVEFGVRCAVNGYSGIYVPCAVASHEGSATLGKWHKDTVRRISRNQVLLIARHFPSNWAFRYGWPVLVSQMLWGLVALRHGAGFSYAAGKLEGLRLYRKLRRKPSGAERALDVVLRESENEIRQLQRETGFDLYWRLYFALT